ncbi:MAG: SDR family NAD(P)-dependent oxidoreductase [Natronospirillum sp.]
MSTWIVGGGAIGRAAATKARQTDTNVYMVSSQTKPQLPSGITHQRTTDWHWHSVQTALNSLPLPTRVVVATGMLSNGEQRPEKRVEDVKPDALLAAFQANTLLPMAVLQHLTSRLSRQDKMQALVVSAKVGSIQDNRLGGWYAYRASKAAINMLVKTTAVEWQRRFPLAAVGSYHPGTTDSPLSQPFQAGLPAGQLKTPSEAAEHLWHVLTKLNTAEASGQFWNWDGTVLPW